MKTKAIIVDIDGTLAHMTGRSPYDYSQVHTDVVDPVIRDIVKRYNDTHHIMIVTGRKRDCEALTHNWLVVNEIPFDGVYMRGSDDTREDSIVKRDIYEKLIEPHYEVDFVLDDRNRVVKMWREIGLKCLQVAEGDF